MKTTLLKSSLTVVNFTVASKDDSWKACFLHNFSSLSWLCIFIYYLTFLGETFPDLVFIVLALCLGPER